jgi:hypothetical protein
MTLILAIDSPKSSWMLADRRLSVNGVPVKEDARKLLLLDATDGFAIVGYAGLGSTLKGTEPSEWMAGVLRRRTLPLEQSLIVLADVMKRELEPHLPTMAGPGPFDHTVVATGFIGDERKVFTIDISVAADGTEHRFECHRQEADVVIAGSGRHRLNKKTAWHTLLGRIINLCDEGRIPPERVADYLAKLNLRTSNWVPSVGPDCIVAWRRRDDARLGFRHRVYSGKKVDENTLLDLPRAHTGTQISQIIDVIRRNPGPRNGFWMNGEKETALTRNNASAELAQLAVDPVEKLD